MKILHTSDWHIGRRLYGRKRYGEFQAFFEWLESLIADQGVEALLVSGDVFDTTTPGSRAQEIYYRFLFRVCSTGLRHVVIAAGNHDSPSFLSAPKELLKAMNIHVIGAASACPADEVIVLKNQSGEPEAIICAVPYLRDRDIRTAVPGESIEEKGAGLVEGIRSHYADVCREAEKQQLDLGEVPVICMGHLFAAGGKTLADDGVRELYVGSLARVGIDVFPGLADYVALGHLHVPQSVGRAEHIRYSGSPIPMGFGEASQEKSVVIADVKKGNLSLDLYPIPCFQVLEKIRGNMDDITKRIDDLRNAGSSAWLEIEYNGEKIPGNLKEQVETLVADTDLEIRRIRNTRVLEKVIEKGLATKTLDDLSEEDVFKRLLDTHDVASEQRPDLILAHREILDGLRDEDKMAD